MTSCELFLGLDKDELSKLDGLGHGVSLSRGTRIFNLGEEATSLLLIEEGIVILTLPLVIHGGTHEVTLDEKSPGSVIAWSALVPPHKLTLGAQASTDVGLVRYDATELRALLDHNPEIHRKILVNLTRVIGSRMATLEALFMRNLQRQITDRVDA